MAWLIRRFRLEEKKERPKMNNRMNRSIIILSTFLALLVIWTERSYSININNLADQSTYRCYGGIVSTGDSARSVADKCGAPLDRTRRESDSYDIWIYQFGQSDFMYYFGFLHGKLQRIVSAPCKATDAVCYDLRWPQKFTCPEIMIASLMPPTCIRFNPP